VVASSQGDIAIFRTAADQVFGLHDKCPHKGGPETRSHLLLLRRRLRRDHRARRRSQITGVRGDPDHPANFGRLCTKGATLHLTARPRPLLHPELPRTVPRRAANCASAGTTRSTTCRQRFAAIIREHGPDAVAFYMSGQLLTEDYYVFNKLAKGLIGTNNVDTNSRLCMSSAVAGYKATLGADAPPCSYEDIDHADCLLIAGANTAFAHPIAVPPHRGARARQSRDEADRRRSAPHRHRRAADLHLAILPGTDICALQRHAACAAVGRPGRPDYIRAHTEGFDVLRAIVRDVHAGVAAASAACAPRTSSPPRAGSARRRRAVAVVPGAQPVQPRHAQQCRADHLHLATGKIGRPAAARSR
jgi:assimilatory nitrate reductase catalytic subunit